MPSPTFSTRPTCLGLRREIEPGDGLAAAASQGRQLFVSEQHVGVMVHQLAI